MSYERGPSMEEMGLTKPLSGKKGKNVDTSPVSIEHHSKPVEPHVPNEQTEAKPEQAKTLSQLQAKDNLDSSTGLEFEILKKLGEGGNGAVFKVEDRKTGIEKALKLLKKDQGQLQDEDSSKRFKREIQILTKIKSPYILQAYDVDTFNIGGQEYIGFVTEVVDGKDIHQELVENGPMRPEDVVKYMGEVLLAFETLRKAGIIHKDVKPKNIFLQDIGSGKKVAKLGDFGLVAFENLSEEQGSGRSHPDIPLDEKEAITPEGFRGGTPQYMSPEAAEFRPTSHKSDMYSLGLVMYEMLTGKRAIQVATEDKKSLDVNKTLDAQSGQHPLPLDLTIAATAPTWLKNIVYKLIKKNPDDRFQSAMDVFLALKEGLKTSAEQEARESESGGSVSSGSPLTKGGLGGSGEKVFTKVLNDEPFMLDIKKTDKEVGLEEAA